MFFINFNSYRVSENNYDTFRDSTQLSFVYDYNRDIDPILDEPMLVTQWQIVLAQEVQAIVPCDPNTNHALGAAIKQ
jgi:hypothetical protein